MKSNDKILLAILWPFGALVSALRNWRQPWAMNVFWVVCIYLGAIQIYHPEGTILGTGADGGRYVLQLIEMHEGSRGLLEQIAYNFSNTLAMDYYQIILTWIVSLFTDNGHVLFACFAAVFGFFYSRNMWYVLNRLSGINNKTILVFVILLFLTCPIWQINGVRMWTAAHVFMYALLPYMWEGDKRRLYWLIAVPFVHFSYLYFVILSVVFVLLPERIIIRSSIFRWGLISLFSVSLVAGAVKVDSVVNMLQQYSPDSHQDRIETYTSESTFERVSEGREQLNWYVTASGNISFWATNVLLLVLAFSSLKDVSSKKLLHYCLLISAIANIAKHIPSGGRFLVIAHLFSLSLIIWQLYENNERLNKWAKICAVPLLITIIFTIRSGFDYYGISMFCGNFMTSIFWNDNVPLINYIK